MGRPRQPARPVARVAFHAAVVLWANGERWASAQPGAERYHQIETDLHWQNAVVDTVAERNRSWSGIHMLGPYVWRPPYYWFSDRYLGRRVAPPPRRVTTKPSAVESLRKFITAVSCGPPTIWYVHAGGNEAGNSTFANISRALDDVVMDHRRARGIREESSARALEDVRAQYETTPHIGKPKMLMHWMMNTPWPSFFGHLYDYYFRQARYFGEKKAMRPVSVVWDYYATGDRTTAHVFAVNQAEQRLRGATVSVAFFNSDGTRKFVREAKGVSVGPFSSTSALEVPRVPGLSSAYFVRCLLTGEDGKPLAENVYWQSTTDDDLGDAKNDDQFTTRLVKWADLTALNSMPPVILKGWATHAAGSSTITLRNDSSQLLSSCAWKSPAKRMAKRFCPSPTRTTTSPFFRTRAQPLLPITRLPGCEADLQFEWKATTLPNRL